MLELINLNNQLFEGDVKMNFIKELENVLKQPNFMGQSDKLGVNLAVNQILDKIEELGFTIVEKEGIEQ